MLGWVQRATFRKYLAGKHLVVNTELADGATALVELDRSGGLLVVIVGIVDRVVLAGDDALAGLVLAGDHRRVGREDERRHGLLGLFYFGGQPLLGALLGADALLVLLPEPADEDQRPDGDDGRAGDDGGDDGRLGAMAFGDVGVGPNAACAGGEGAWVGRMPRL